MEPYSLPASPHVETAIFNGTTSATTSGWQTWTKPAGKAFANIMAIGGGGGGGSGAIGAVGAAAGGGGGGSGGISIIDIPLAFLPPRLYILVGAAKTANGISAYVSTQPNITSNHVFVYAAGGGLGGNASAGTAGIAGNAGSAATTTSMPLGWPFLNAAYAGQNGSIGGGAVTGAGVTLPLTGLRVTAGSGGGGLPASGAGSAGGSFSIPSAQSYFMYQAGGLSPTSASDAPGIGQHGFRLDTGAGGHFYYGGSGGASTHASASGPGLVQARGGNGGIGCGGGGMGGALTGSTAAGVSLGGAGLVVITCY